MNYNLICVNPFHGYDKGQIVTDPAEVAKLLDDRDHHFVKIAAPEPVIALDPASEPSKPTKGK